VERLVADAALPQSRPPARVRLKSPLRYRFLACGWSGRTVVTTSGRLRRVTVWVSLAKVQSLRRVEGPLQRRLRLASIELDTAGRRLGATLRDRDVAEADAVFDELVLRARVERRAAAGAAQAGVA
jgi:putative membrane protein